MKVNMLFLYFLEMRKGGKILRKLRIFAVFEDFSAQGFYEKL